VVILYGLIVAAAVFAIAAFVIGREARRLDAVPPRALFDMDEAVTWVADHLPFEVSAVLSHNDVRQILDWNLEYFRTKGASGNGSTVHAEGPVVVGGAETVDWVLGRAQSVGTTYSAAQVHAVLDAQMMYLEASGAIGPEAPPGDAGATPGPAAG
jgi:heptaprenylglyceryl phosphate synthase